MYESNSECGGGIILSQIHEFDYIYSLFGLPKRVFTIGGHISMLEINSEDVASTLLEYEIGGKCIPIHIYQDFVQREPSRTCKIVGEKATLVMDLLKGADRDKLFLDEMNHFLTCLHGAKTPMVTVREGAQSLRMALAAKESMKTRKVIEL
jgi:predicted dehydrogenase